MSGAWLTPCRGEGAQVPAAGGAYRYCLTRLWNRSLPPLYVGMLNPSLASAAQDDATIRKLVGFGSRLNCGSLVVWNLFAYRTPYPRVLWQTEDPIGPANDGTISRLLADFALGRVNARFLDQPPGARFVIAWGALPQWAHERSIEVLNLISAHGITPKCWGMTQDGFPRHPSRIAYATPLDHYTGPWARPSTDRAH